MPALLDVLFDVPGSFLDANAQTGPVYQLVSRAANPEAVRRPKGCGGGAATSTDAPAYDAFGLVLEEA